MTGTGKWTFGWQFGLVITRDLGEVADLDDDEPSRPWRVDRRARMLGRGVPRDEVAWDNQVPSASTAGAHRIRCDDSEHVLAARVDCVLGRLACHQEDRSEE